MYFLPFLCQQLIHPVSQIVCLRFVSDGRFLFPHISQLPEDFVMSPSITLLSRRYLIPYTIQVYAIVPFFAVFKVWILIAVCRRFSCVSFSDFIRIDIQNWTTHIFVHINSCSGYQVSPHLAPPSPFLPGCNYLQCFLLILLCLTLVWTIKHLSAADAFDNCWKFDIPTPCRACVSNYACLHVEYSI